LRFIDFVELSILGALWGGSFLFMRIAAPEFGPVTLIALRVFIAAAVLVPVLLYQRKWRPVIENPGPLLFVGISNSALPFSLFAFATLTLTAGYTSVLNAAVPLLTAVVARVWLKERLTPGALVGLVIGVSGVVLLVQDKLGFNTSGQTLAIAAGLLASVSYAVAANYTQRSLQGFGSLELATGSQLSAALVMLIPGLLLWPEHDVSMRSWVSVVVLGGACTGVAYILFFRLIARIGTPRAVTVTYVVPIFSMLFGSLFLGEMVTAAMIGACALILLGTGLATGLFHPLR
jgi:drug/metabolite transporter (DMT)-like permease